MVQLLALGLQIPEDNPDRNKYFSMQPRDHRLNSSGVAELTLMSPGDILFLYTDGVYDGSNEQERRQLENIICDHYQQSAKDLCNALLEHAVRQDEVRRQNGEDDLIDDKTAFVIKRT
jgi:serine/threonine protein phosphatase PrpC